MNKYFLYIVFNIATFICIQIHTADAQSLNNYSVVLSIEKEGSDFVFIIDNSFKSNRLLLDLPCRENINNKQNAKSLLTVHEDCKISMLVNTLGIMRKAGCGKPDVLYFDNNKTYFVKIDLSKSFPWEEIVSKGDKFSEQSGTDHNY